MMSRKYQYPPREATGCRPLQSRNRRARYSVARVVAVPEWGSAFWVPAGQALHLSMSLTYITRDKFWEFSTCVNYASKNVIYASKNVIYASTCISRK